MEITLGHTYRWHATTEIVYMDLCCNLCGETFEHDFSWYAHQPFPDMNVVPQPNC